MPVRLALSLHAADDALRSQLMPVNERYPLRDVLDACRAFYARKRRRVFVEYVMLAGVNDRYEQALALARRVERGSRGGPVDLQGQPDPLQLHGPRRRRQRAPVSGRESIAAFRAALEAHGVPVTVRLTRGRGRSRLRAGSSRRRRRAPLAAHPSAPAPVGARAPSRPDSESSEQQPAPRQGTITLKPSPPPMSEGFVPIS